MSTPSSNATSSKPVCVVTGSSSGIGASTALLFAQRGHDIVINYAKQAEPAQRVAAQCREAGAEVLVVQADVSDDAQCVRLADAVRERWGHADTLVNSAGLTTKVADIKDLHALDAEDFAAIYRVNVIGVYQMVRAVAPLMKGRPHPAVVNISSLAGRLGTGSSIAYAASKGAVNTLTLSLARSLAPEIRVNAVLPGLVDTPWFRRGLDETAIAARINRFSSRALLNDVTMPDDVARAVWYLAHDALKQTGQLIDLDAGFAMG